MRNALGRCQPHLALSLAGEVGEVSTVLAMLAALAIIYVVPLIVYGVAGSLGGLELPKGAAPGSFLLGILVTKLGTAVAFVLLFQLIDASLAGRWWPYGLIWFGMFAASEVGDAISGRSTWPEAALGIISEAIYAPASAFAVQKIVGGG